MISLGNMQLYMYELVHLPWSKTCAVRQQYLGWSLDRHLHVLLRNMQTQTVILSIVGVAAFLHNYNYREICKRAIIHLPSLWLYFFTGKSIHDSFFLCLIITRNDGAKNVYSHQLIITSINGRVVDYVLGSMHASACTQSKFN